jgi:NADPH-dependent 2,4-dienoyl-CoA reductase/sulfur reductase-like enzyme/rhodanese-related sulfurtransferase
MEKSDFVIIGGVACGTKTGATLARRMPEAKITLFQKEERLSYGTCGLPYFASGDINTFAELASTSYGIPRDADFFKTTRGFDVVTEAEVTAIDRANKVVTVKDLTSGETYEHGYDKLVLATGATPNEPPFPVPDSPKIRPFTRPDDAIAFRKLAQQGQIEKALVVGGGFIGCEVAEAAGGLWGIEVILIEKENQLLPYALDPEMAEIAEREMKRQNVDLRIGAMIEKIELNEEEQPVAYLNDGTTVTADYVFLCLGVTPLTNLAQGAGLEIGPSGGIAVNSKLQTSDENIFAGGDCVESVHRLSGKPFFLPMGSLANRHGRVIAENLAGNETEWPGVLGTFLVKVFDTNVGAVGLSESAAENAGLETEAVWGSFPDKPDFFPEGNTFVLKMVYERKSGDLLGLQAAGAGDICRRVDVFSSFLLHDASIESLLDFEHGYAPPYSEALDPLHHLAGIALAKQAGATFLVPTIEFDPTDTDTVLIDVRQAEEAEEEPYLAADGAKWPVVNIPLEELRVRTREIDAGKRVVVMCKRGPRSYQAACILKAAGFERVDILSGGLQSRL